MNEHMHGDAGEARCAECTRPMAVPASASNKRFCSSGCRNEWWKRRQRAARQALAERERQQQPSSGSHPSGSHSNSEGE